jgi:hypothetical protein
MAFLHTMSSCSQWCHGRFHTRKSLPSSFSSVPTINMFSYDDNFGEGNEFGRRAISTPARYKRKTKQRFIYLYSNVRGGGKLRSNFQTEREWVYNFANTPNRKLAVSKTENLRFWFWTATGDNFFFCFTTLIQLPPMAHIKIAFYH